jgi:hypothetical protein
MAVAVGVRKTPVPTPKPKKVPVTKPPVTAKKPTDVGFWDQDPATIEAALRQEPTWPSVAQIWNIPELRQAFIVAHQKGWSAADTQTYLQGTNWFKATPAAARTWLGMSPADQQVAVDDQITKVRTAARETYWVPMTDQGMRDWATKLASGAVDQNTFDQYLRDQAKGLFGNNASMSAAIDRGVTPQTLLSPYLSLASTELERPTDSLVGDPRIFGGIMSGTMPTMSDFTASLRQLPEWKDTQKANDTTSTLLKQMLSTFGGPKV